MASQYKLSHHCTDIITRCGCGERINNVRVLNAVLMENVMNFNGHIKRLVFCVQISCKKFWVDVLTGTDFLMIKLYGLKTLTKLTWY